MADEYAGSLIHKRNDNVDGVGPWYWIQKDTGAWFGPKQDWEHSHKAKYLQHVTDWCLVVQAGGCQGMYPRLFANMFQRVYTFEPDPLNFLCLVNNCQLDNIIKMQSALGAECKLITVNRLNPENVGENRVTEEFQFVPMITIDTLNLDGCGLIQLDVETYERNVILGAMETIKKYKPVITCENGKDGEIIELLSPLGYQIVDESRGDTFYKVL